MYKIGEKRGFFFNGVGGGQAGFASHNWTKLAFLIFSLYHVSSCFLVLPILQASLELTQKMIETYTNLRVRRS